MRKANDLFCTRRSLRRDTRTREARILSGRNPAYAHQLASSKQFQLYRNTLLRSLLNIESI